MKMRCIEQAEKVKLKSRRLKITRSRKMLFHAADESNPLFDKWKKDKSQQGTTTKKKTLLNQRNQVSLVELKNSLRAFLLLQRAATNL